MSPSQSGSLAPFLSLFAATSQIRTTCTSCHQAQVSSPQSFAACALDERYYTLNLIGSGVLSTSLKRFNCNCYFSNFANQAAELVFPTFPDILVVNIAHVNNTDMPAIKILPKIMLKGSGI